MGERDLIGLLLVSACLLLFARLHNARIDRLYRTGAQRDLDGTRGDTYAISHPHETVSVETGIYRSAVTTGEAVETEEDPWRNTA